MKSKFKNFICFMLVALLGIAMITPDDAQARSPLWGGGLHQQQDDSNHVAGEDVRILSVNWADSFGNTKDADTNGLHTQQDDLTVNSDTMACNTLLYNAANYIGNAPSNR